MTVMPRAGIGCPHPTQNFDSGGTSAPHPGHFGLVASALTAIAFPHPMQNRLSSGFSTPQLEHFAMNLLLPDCTILSQGGDSYRLKLFLFCEDLVSPESDEKKQQTHQRTEYLSGVKVQ